MSDKKMSLFDWANKAQVKFNYFMCSATGALLAYIAQTYTPQKLDNLFSDLQTVSLGFFAVSFYSGIKRLLITNKTLHLNFNAASLTEIAEGITDLSEAGKTKKTHVLSTIDEVNNVIWKGEKKHRTLERWQLSCFFLGFLILLLAKVLQPYQSDFSRHLNTANQITNRIEPSVSEISPNKPAKQ